MREYDRIWKYPLSITDIQNINIPSRHRILSAGIDPENNVCVWALVASNDAKENVEIRIFGTGTPVDEFGEFIGSVRDGVAIWHIFTGPGIGLS